MKDIGELRRWAGLVEADFDALTRLAPYVEPHLVSISDEFYERLRSSPEAVAVFADDDQVARLKRAMGLWILEMLQGPWDAAYIERRTRIGRRHVQVGLPHRFMFPAMDVLRQALCRVAQESFPVESAPEICGAVIKMMSMELALITDSFMKEHEQGEMLDMQELVLAQLPLWVLLLAEDGSVVAASGSPTWFRRVTEIGEHWRDAVPAELAKAADLEQQIDNAREKHSIVTLPRVDVELGGRALSLALTVVPLEHRLASYMVHVEDLTMVVEAEAQLRAQAVLAQLGALSAGVAHELRNPLAGISGAVQVLARSFEPDDRRGRIMHKVREQIGRLDRMVTDLLSFARPREARCEPAQLAEVMRTVVESMPEAQRASVAVEGEGGAVVDVDHLHRILLNLVQNGLQAGESVEVQLSPGRVQVHDDGPGVPEELRAQIFEPFFTTRTQGTGLGLSICRSLAEGMGGELNLLEGEGGATFVVTLPQ